VRLTETQTAEVRCQWFAARDVGIPGGGAAFPATATATYPATRRTLAEITWSRTRPQAPWRQSELRLFVQTIDRRVEVVPHTVSYLPASATAPFRRVRPLLIQPSADHDARGVRWNNTVRTGRHTLVFGVDAWEKRLRSHRRRVTEIAVLAPDSTVLRTSTTAVEDRSLPNSAFLPFGLYLEDELALSARAALVAGVRIDRIRITGEKTYVTYVPATEAVLWDAATETDYSLSGQVRLSYRFGTHLEGYANLARSFRAPSLEERFLFVDLGSTVRWGDPALRSEDGLFAELGLSAQSDRLRATGQVFANRILDMVIERPALYEGRPALRKANAGEALLWGWEAGLGYTPRSDVLLSASAASVRGTDEKENTPLPAMPPLTGSLGARCGNRRWLAADLELAAPQRRVAAGESTTGGHLTLGVSAGLERIAWGGAAHRLTAGVRNALDAAYRDHLATSRGTPLTAPGRSVFVTWSVER